MIRLGTLTLFTVAALLLAPIPSAHAGETYDRVMESGKIRCGYYLWNPMIQRDIATGETRGSFVEIMEEIGRRLSLEVEWTEEPPVSALVEGVRTNRYDMICAPLYVLASRARVVHYTSPLIYAPIQLAARADDERFTADMDLSEFNSSDYTFATQEGEAGDIITRQRFPEGKVNPVPTIADYTQIYQELTSGKADIAAVVPQTFYEFDKANPGKLKLLPQIVSLSSATLATPNNDFAFASMIDGAVREIVNDGTVAEILRKHGELKFFPVPQPNLIRE